MPRTNLNTPNSNLEIPDGSISENKLNFSIDKFPTGTIAMHAGVSAPDGWLLCNGDELPNGVGVIQNKQDDFSKLYAVLGATYGAQGKLPNCRGVFVRGAGSQSIGGKNYTASIGSVAGDKTLRHVHSVTGNVTSTATSNVVQNISNPFPAIRYESTNLASRQAVVSVSGTGVSSTKEWFWGGTSQNNPEQTAIPTVTTSVSNTHNLNTQFQTDGDTNETAPASIGLNYIIKI